MKTKPTNQFRAQAILLSILVLTGLILKNRIPTVNIYRIFGILISLCPFILILTESKGEAAPIVEQLEKLITSLEHQNNLLVKEKYQLQQEVLRLRAKTKKLEDTNEEWIERSLEVFKMIERAISAPNLDASYLQAMLKTKDQFTQLVAPMGIHVLEPKPGDIFYDKVHQVVQEVEDHSQPPWIIVECVEWGYMIDGKVKSPAKVIISHRG